MLNSITNNLKFSKHTYTWTSDLIYLNLEGKNWHSSEQEYEMIPRVSRYNIIRSEKLCKPQDYPELNITSKQNETHQHLHLKSFDLKKHNTPI